MNPLRLFLVPAFLALSSCGTTTCPEGFLRDNDGHCLQQHADCPEGFLRANDGNCLQIDLPQDSGASDTGEEDTGSVDTGTQDTGNDTGDTGAVPFGLDSRPANPTCVAPDRPPSGASIPLKGEKQFESMTWTDSLVRIVQNPENTSSWYALTQLEEKIVAFDDTPDASTTRDFLDLTGKVRTAGERGILSLLFFPGWAEDPVALVFYTASPRDAEEDSVSTLSRFRSTDGGATLDPSTEEVLIEVPQVSNTHKGSALAWGPDGELYVSFGDDGRLYGDGRVESSQDKSIFKGKILRIHVEKTGPYSVPSDNPFVGSDDRSEIWAYGLRNPWTMTFDEATGDLYVGDVGRSDREEIDIITKGGNYGWPIKEGTLCFMDEVTSCDDPSLIDPVFEYTHDVGVVVIGGYVYHGQAIPELQGTYLFADGNQRVWGLFYDELGQAYSELLWAPPSASLIRSWAQTKDGELLFLQKDTIWQLVLEANTTPPTPFPVELSETGCVDPNDPTTPATGLIPFEPRVPLWSDYAEKSRWLAIPDGTTIHLDADGDFEFPIGSVMMKEFRRNGRIVETRLFVRHDDGGWAGYSYEWNEAQTDATLVRGRRVVEMSDGYDYLFPSASQCLACHTEAAGNTLGPETLQLNGPALYPSTGRTANQMTTLEHIGMFDLPLSAAPEALPRLPHSDEGPLTAAESSRAYVHANCSNCHRPNGPGGGFADYRFVMGGSIADWGVCGEQAVLGEPIPIVSPGEPWNSAISRRMHSLGSERMPPLATGIVDYENVAQMDLMIQSLQGCP